MTLAELKDAIASGSKLTKADAGRFSTGPTSDVERTIRVINIRSVNAKDKLAFVAALWNRLTPTQVETWNTGAIGFPAKNKYGDIYTPSGYQVFMKLNLNLYSVNAPLLLNCPVPDFPVCPVVTLNNLNTPELLMFNFAGGIPVNQFVQVFSYSQVQQGSTVRNGKAKQLGYCGKLTKADAGRNLDKAILEEEETSRLPLENIDVTGQFQNLFAAVKSKALLFFKFVPISAVTGQAGVPVIVPVQIPNFVKVPKIITYSAGEFLPAISVGNKWRIPFRVDAFNLTDPLVLSIALDPAGRFKISRSLTGPFGLGFSVPLNELGQPEQNVFYIQFDIAAPSTIGCIVNFESIGATPNSLGFGGDAVDQAITINPALTAFGNVFTSVPEVFEIAAPYVALRSNISYSLTGANAQLFKIARSPLGPWLPTLNFLIDGVGSDAEAKIYCQVIGDGVGAITCDLNYQSGLDIISSVVLSANDIDGIITSPNSPGDNFGNNAIGVDIIWDFAAQGSGLATNAGVFTSNLVNCTVQYGPTAVGPWGNSTVMLKTGSSLPLTQVFFKAVPTALGAFSWDTNIQAAVTNAVVLSYSGVGI